MVIEKNKVVSLVYTLTENDSTGTLIEKVNEDKPFEFIFGLGHLLPKFENELSSLKAGDHFSFHLKPEDAYGNHNSTSVVDVPKTIFEVNGVIDLEVCKVGNIVPMQNEQGQPFTGLITSISETQVTMDFNHPLAGIHLFFSGKILNVRQASEDELSHGHVHNHEHGHHECH